MPNLIEVRFNCHTCGLRYRRAKARVRGVDQDIEDWMNNNVAPAVHAVHRLLSPVCPSTCFDLMFSAPSEGEPGRVGDADRTFPKENPFDKKDQQRKTDVT